MSFIDDLVGGAGSFAGNLAGNMAKTALLGFALNQVTKSINNNNTLPATTATSIPDNQTRLQNNASTENKIPVVYGTAFLGGIVSDAVITTDLATMYFCLTICEKTGNTNLGSGDPSTFTFKNLYWNDNKIFFDADGITVSHTEDRDGNIDTNFAGLIQIYCYNGGSSSPCVPTGYTNTSLSNAFAIMPDWTTNHTMNELIFAIVKVTYNTEKGLTGLGTVKFQIQNSMTLPGDVMYDYMTNSRYGAGIDPTEIYVS
jgi:hypothetical protein